MKTKFHNVTGLEIAYDDLSVKIMHICRKIDNSLFILPDSKEKLIKELNELLAQRDIVKNAMLQSP